MSNEIKSIRKLDKHEYEGLYKYSLNIEKNHNYFIDSNILSKNCLILVDEFQNISVENSKTILSRLGHDSKMIILGDVKQVDLKNKEISALMNIINMFKDVDGIGVVEMNPNDVSIRNPLIDVIEAKFDELEENNKKPRTLKKDILTD